MARTAAPRLSSATPAALSPRALGRALAGLYTVGALVAAGWLLLPATAEQGARATALAAVGAAALGVALLVALRRATVPTPVLHGALALVQLGIGAAWTAGGDPNNNASIFVLWAAPYAALYFRRRTAALHTLWSGVVVVGSLALMPARTHPAALGAGLLLLSTLGATSLLAAGMAAALRSAERTQRHAASHDALTGLPNRRRLLEQLSGLLTRPAAGRCALVLLDLDGFKAVNDRHGHAEGDALLRRVAGQLRGAAGERDLVCRLGGDEFAVLLVDLDAAAATRAAQRLVAAVDSGASGGLRLLDSDLSPDQALHDADVALYLSKREGRGLLHRWRPGLQSADAAQRALAADLADGLRHGQLRLVYQPVVDTLTLRVHGMESLARWRHPVRGDVAPDVFIPCAEQSGLIAELTCWVLHTACTHAATWPAAADGDQLNLSVNISAVSLADLRVVDDVRAALDASGLPPRRLLLEVTETAAVQDLASARRTLEELVGLGVVLALDDFGTGYSSLAHVLALPFNVLKVDRSFTAGALEGDRRAVATIAAVCALAAGLDVDVVAEGVEDMHQLPALSALGCGYVQGYALSRPLPPDDVSVALAAQGPEGWLLGGPAKLPVNAA